MIKKETIRGEMKKVSFEGLFTIFQESKPIYHPLLLRQLFVKGHMSLILTILCKLHSLLESDENTSKVPAFLDFSLESILSEINLDKSEKMLDNTKRHKDTALGLFENQFTWDDVPTSIFDNKPNKDPKVKIEIVKSIQDQFEEIKDNLLSSLIGSK